MRIRDVLTAGAFLVVLVGFAGFLRWYFGPDWQRWLDGSTVRTGSAPTLSVAGTQASPAPEPTATASPQPVLAPYCQPGQEPRFQMGFAELKRAVGAPMGDPIECEHANPDNGDSLQQTTTGLAVFRKQDGQLSFTNGWDHWAITPQGLVTWQGDAEPTPASGG